MIFSIIILLLVAAVTYFHYVQGFFSAMISAFIAVIAAVMAVSYHEVVVEKLSQGRVSDMANGMALCVLYAAIYLLLRLIFDKAIQGNVGYPVLVDKIGAGVMGFIAAIFATGVVAIAAQTLPFGVDVAQYTRFQTNDRRDAVVPGAPGQQQKNAFIYDEVKEQSFAETTRSTMWVPVDDMLLSLVSKLSEGSLSGDRTLTSVHPDYLAELFGQRLGVQVGAKHTMTNATGKEMEIKGLAVQDVVEQIDAENPNIRGGRKISPTLRPDQGQMLLIVRIMFFKDASDISDGVLRISPGGVRLVAHGKNYFPLGTLDGGTLVSNRIDDPIFLDLKGVDRGADFLFLVDTADVLDPGQPDPKKQPLKVQDGVFIETKRLAREDLSGKAIEPKLPASPEIAVLRKTGLIAEKKAPPATAPTAPTAAPVTPGVPPAPGAAPAPGMPPPPGAPPAPPK